MKYHHCPGFKYENPPWNGLHFGECCSWLKKKMWFKTQANQPWTKCGKNRFAFSFASFQRMSLKVMAMAACLGSSPWSVRKAPLFNEHLYFLPMIHWWLHVPRRSYWNKVSNEKEFSAKSFKNFKHIADCFQGWKKHMWPAEIWLSNISIKLKTDVFVLRRFLVQCVWITSCCFLR